MHSKEAPEKSGAFCVCGEKWDGAKGPCQHEAMLTEEDARRLVLAEIDAMRSRLAYDLQIQRVEVLHAPVSHQIADYERRLRREAHARNLAVKQAAPQE